MGPIPSGVPVEMISPGSSVITKVTNSTSWSIGKISSFVLAPADAGRQPDWIARSDHRRPRLDEDERLGGERLAALGRMILVVQPDAHDFRRRDGRKQRDGAEASSDRRAM